VLQEEDPEEVNVTGVVVALNEEAGTITVEADGETYVVEVPDGFDWAAIGEGSVVEVEGRLDESGVIVADKVKDETEPEDEDPEASGEDDDDGVGYFCANTDVQHPVGRTLTRVYDVTYTEVMAWFCDEGMGFGQIMLALQTADVIGGDASELLALRAQGQGWGKIWKSFDLIGNRRGNGRPDHAGPPDEGDRPDGVGRPAHAGTPGPPDHAGIPGRPDHAGLPKDKGPSKKSED
jgi:hypothetical protein